MSTFFKNRQAAYKCLAEIMNRAASKYKVMGSFVLLSQVILNWEAFIEEDFDAAM